jgi:hypothetical protein
VPPPVGLGGGEHATSAAHVTEGTLAGAVGTTSGHARNTGHGTTSTPRLGRRLHAGAAGDGVGLTAVLGEGRVNLLDDVGTDGRGEHRGEHHSGASAFTTVNLNEGTRGLDSTSMGITSLEPRKNNSP